MASDSPVKRCEVVDTTNARNVEPLRVDKGGGDIAAANDRNVRPAEIARVCARLGQAQQGCVKRAQLLDAGVSRHAISYALAKGALHLKHRGVYVVGHLALAAYANEAAALLACRAGSVISHRSAAWLWGLLDEQPGPVEVMMVGGWCRPKQGIRIHWVTAIDDRELRRRHGLPRHLPRQNGD
jgi:hypothetical protein